MSRTIQALRASITVGAFLIAGITAHAADTSVQRVAMARTHSSDAIASAHATRATPSAQRAATAVAKAPARRTQDARVASRDSDGSRFTYDSCGCSN